MQLPLVFLCALVSSRILTSESTSAEFGLSPAAELSEESLIIDCADSAEVSEEPPALKKRKSPSLMTVLPRVRFIPAVPNLSTPGCGSTTSCHPVLIATSGVYA